MTKTIIESVTEQTWTPIELQTPRRITTSAYECPPGVRRIRYQSTG
jgi:hypothetical protein